jgi:hypothetical protein
MAKRATLPVEGKAIRFAPGRELTPATWFWRIWAEGNEIYALTRNFNGVCKLSVHASGQIHYRLGPKHKQDLAGMTHLGSLPWSHAFEIRFLVSEGANAPPPQRESLKNKSAYVLTVPSSHYLVVNLIIATAGSALDCPLPAEFSGATLFWRARLPDGRLAVLIGRVMTLDGENREKIRFYRETLKPTATYTGPVRDPYIELHHLPWSPGGNVVLVVPMGNEAVRVDEDVTSLRATATHREFLYKSPRSATSIIAPNGVRVAVLEIHEVEKQIDLVKDVPSIHEVGVVSMRVEPSNLIAGSEFIASPCILVSTPTVSGASLRSWEHLVFPRFDGFALTAELRQLSTSLQNKNLAAPLSRLEDGEELTICIPSETLNLVATIDAPSTSAKVLGRFTLRDSR